MFLRFRLVALLTTILLLPVGSVFLELSSPQVALAQTRSDRKAEGDRLLQQGARQYQMSRYQEALSCFEQTLRIYREISYRNGEAVVLMNLGVVYFHLAQHDKSISYYD